MKKNLISFLTFSFILAVYSLSAQIIYQAEDANVISRGAVETDHAGYTGTGYVNGDNAVGPYVEWAVSQDTAGEQTLTIVYAHGKTDDRSMKLTVNGTDVKTINFPTTGAWTTYSSLQESVTLIEGLNVIRLTSASGNGGPNLDRIELTGEQGPAFSTLKTAVVGEGSVQISPEQDYYLIGSEVKLSAHAADTFFLAGWKGNVNSSDSAITITIDTVNSMTALFMRYNNLVRTTEKVGWCEQAGATTGGEGGTEVTVTNQSELTTAVSGSDFKIVKVSGTIELSPMGTEISVGSNTTVTGIDENSVIKGGGFIIRDANNVIIRDLTFKDAYVDWEGKTTDNDAIEVNNSTHVWITHCDFSHFDDGLCDIKNGSDFVTVSWCHFHNHNKVMLIGSADDQPQDVGHLNVTVHHNWFDGRFDNGIGQRLPMARYGKIHVFNNYYVDVITRGAEANYEVDMVVDNNYYYNTEMPHVLVGGAGDNKINASGNIYVSSGSRRDNSGDAFNPADYYDYTYNNAEDVPVIVMLGVGPFADTLLGRIDSTWIPEDKPSSVLEVSGTNIKIKAYPQPATESLVVEISGLAETSCSFEVFSLTGSRIDEMNNIKLAPGNAKVELNTAAYLPGTYLLKVSTQSEILTKTIVIR